VADLPIEPKGSPPGVLADSDWSAIVKSVIWTMLTAVVAAALTAGLDVLINQIMPDLQDKLSLDATLFALLMTVLHALRKAVQAYITDTRTIKVLAMLAVLVGAASTQAADWTGTIKGVEPGVKYSFTLGADGNPVIVPLPVVTVGVNPNPLPIPDPAPGPTQLEKDIEAEAKAALAAGGTPTTGAAFCEVFYIVSGAVADGTIPPEQAIGMANVATKAVMTKATDSVRWVAFELKVRNELINGDAQGKWKTKDDFAGALRQISNGLSKATGYTPVGAKALLAFDVSTPAKMAAARKANGILDTINLAQLMDFIRFVMDLLKIFFPTLLP
jgi:hypothetical protein